MGRSGEDIHRPCRIYSEKESSMDKIKKNFGFGCMRFPMIGEEIDDPALFQAMIYFFKLYLSKSLFITLQGNIFDKTRFCICFNCT